MTDESWSQRAARVLAEHGLAFADYCLMGTAGYRINLERPKFVRQAYREYKGWLEVNARELDEALDRLIVSGLMSVLTEADLQEERERRGASSVPEVDDVGYGPGHVDFTPKGYLLFRELTRLIQGEEFLIANDSGFNLDTTAGRFDFYAVRQKDCEDYMSSVRAAGDSYTGVAGTVFTTVEAPVEIGPWRPVRFFRCSAGYHGVLYFGARGAAQQGVAAAGAPPRR